MDEEVIFLTASQIAAPRERAEFLLNACGSNLPLRQSVEGLLRHHELASKFLECPPAEFAQEGCLEFADTRCLDESQVATVGDWRRDWIDSLLSPSETPGCLGTLGPYEVLEVHGQGGMGVVFRARDPKLNRIVAIKMMAANLSANPTAIEAFLREARAMAVVRHRHVVAIHHVDDRGSLPYLVMELVEGISLQKRILESGPLPIAEVLRIGAQLAAGLAAIHDRGLVHRDINPSNVLLDGAEQEVKIADFGLAAETSAAVGTTAAEIRGTPQYMSPEQARGLVCDHRGDLYGLGGVLYAMCSGRPPHSADAALQALRGSADKPQPLRSLNASVPLWLAEIVHRLLEADPAKRPSTAAEIAELFSQQSIQSSSQSLSRHMLSQPARVGWLKSRRGALTALAAIAALAALGAVVVIVRRGDETTRLEVPPGATVKVNGDGQIEVELPDRTERPPAGQTSDRSTAPVDDSAAQKTLKTVVAELKRKNPDFDGDLEPTIEGAKITGVALRADGVTDLSPLRSLGDLKHVACDSSDPEVHAALSDLSPLKDLRLESLSFAGTSVRDLTPLKSMPLRLLNCPRTSVDDLSPLAGMPLHTLSVQGSPVKDLSPLRGMPLNELNVSHTSVADFSPLRGMPLVAFYCDGTKAQDLSPLRELPLKTFNWRGYNTGNRAFLEVVKSIATLETIDSLPTAQFWESVPQGPD